MLKGAKDIAKNFKEMQQPIQDLKELLKQLLTSIEAQNKTLIEIRDKIPDKEEKPENKKYDGWSDDE